MLVVETHVRWVSPERKLADNFEGRKVADVKKTLAYECQYLLEGCPGFVGLSLQPPARCVSDEQGIAQVDGEVGEQGVMGIPCFEEESCLWNLVRSVLYTPHVGIVHGVAEGGISLEPFQFDCLQLLDIQNCDTKRRVNGIENTAEFVCECCGLRTPVNVISTYRPDTRSSLKLTSQRRLVG